MRRSAPATVAFDPYYIDPSKTFDPDFFSDGTPVVRSLVSAGAPAVRAGAPLAPPLMSAAAVLAAVPPVAAQTRPESTESPAQTRAARHRLTVEKVGAGLSVAAVAVPVGAVLAAMMWRAGIAPWLSGLIIAGMAQGLYATGAGVTARRGFLPLVGIVLLGVAAASLMYAGTDLDGYFSAHQADAMTGRWNFVLRGMLAPGMIQLYAGDILALLMAAGAGLAVGALTGLRGPRRR